ncbi:MAG: DUF3667 domain-containing protein [Bacteroidota bacterium]
MSEPHVSPDLALASEVPSGDGLAVCPNCETPRLGDYCHACGQYHLDDRLTVRLLLREFARRFLKLEQGIVYTAWRSMVAPGHLAKEYVSGKRRRYVNPLSYLLIGAAIGVLLMPFYASERHMAALPDGPGDPASQMSTGLDIGMRMNGEDPSSLTEAERQEILARSEETMAEFLPLYLETMAQLNSVFTVALAFALAVLLKLLFSGRTQTYTLAETLVLGAYVSGAYSIVSAVTASLVALVANPAVASMATLVLFIGFTAYAASGFYRRTWGDAALGAVAGTGALAIYLVTVVVVSIPVVLFRMASAG